MVALRGRIVTQSRNQPANVADRGREIGPSGFIQFEGAMYVVDFGRILQADGTVVGFLYEDGHMRCYGGPLGQSEKLKPIDEFEGMTFQGIDGSGFELELPGEHFGPTGELTYYEMPLHVVYGRVADSQHRLVGEFDDDGVVYIRDRFRRHPRRKLDEFTQMNTVFTGWSSEGEKWNFEFIRHKHRKGYTYPENEIIHYFDDFDKLNKLQKTYLQHNLMLWAASGILQIVRKSEGTCALGNVKHGAAGVTGVRTGYVTLDKDEFNREIKWFSEIGPVVTLETQMKPLVEVRVTLLVAHEFGHQLEFCLSQKTQKYIEELYEGHKSRSDRAFPLPLDYRGHSELLRREQVERRTFISGYSKASWHEYWAEAVSAFSFRPCRQVLKQYDPAICEVLTEIVLEPQNVLRTVFQDTVLELQANLRSCGVFHERILDIF